MNQGVTGQEIEVTPEMIEAGYWYVFEFDRETESISSLVERVYRSMEWCRLNGLCGKHPNLRQEHQ